MVQGLGQGARVEGVGDLIHGVVVGVGAIEHRDPHHGRRLRDLTVEETELEDVGGARLDADVHAARNSGRRERGGFLETEPEEACRLDPDHVREAWGEGLPGGGNEGDGGEVRHGGCVGGVGAGEAWWNSGVGIEG